MAIAFTLTGDMNGAGTILPVVLPELTRVLDVTNIDRLLVLDTGHTVDASIASTTEDVGLEDILNIRYILTGTGSSDFNIVASSNGPTNGNLAEDGFYFFIENRSTKTIPVDGYFASLDGGVGATTPFLTKQLSLLVT